MKRVEVELPDHIPAEMEALIADGWFRSEVQLVREALKHFLHRRPFVLQRRFQLEDIEGALRHRKKGL